MNIQGRRDHRRLKLSVGDIYLQNRKAKFEPTHPVHKTQASDPFLSYKESYQLPVFKTIERNDTLDLKKRLRSLESSFSPSRPKIFPRIRELNLCLIDKKLSNYKKFPYSSLYQPINDSTLCPLCSYQPHLVLIFSCLLSLFSYLFTYNIDQEQVLPRMAKAKVEVLEQVTGILGCHHLCLILLYQLNQIMPAPKMKYQAISFDKLQPARQPYMFS